MAIEFTQISGAKNSGSTSETFLQIDSFAYDFADLINNEDLYFTKTRVSTEEEYTLLNSLFDNINNGTNNINGIKVKLIVSSALLFDGILRYTIRDQNGVIHFFSTIPLDNRTFNFYLSVSHNGSGTTMDLTFTKIVLESDLSNSGTTNLVCENVEFPDIGSDLSNSESSSTKTYVRSSTSEEQEVIDQIVTLYNQKKLGNILVTGIGDDKHIFNLIYLNSNTITLNCSYPQSSSYIQGYSISYNFGDKRIFFSYISIELKPNIKSLISTTLQSPSNEEWYYSINKTPTYGRPYTIKFEVSNLYNLQSTIDIRYNIISNGNSMIVNLENELWLFNFYISSDATKLYANVYRSFNGALDLSSFKDLITKIYTISSSYPTIFLTELALAKYE